VEIVLIYKGDIMATLLQPPGKLQSGKPGPENDDFLASHIRKQFAPEGYKTIPNKKPPQGS
jgi:hypothetical protein